ncbi:hypothetical protein FHS82_002396 [Pseudochelatococcus lubricantis]|uniref:Uncharacterized protein n=1 Tax=Pseudochelatococcus lubricantis TaxID=1538102 RepID=A0ABX0V007_9HYPH|nr:hypothetical protein [Pseudochelatococcus lubricantis]
MGSMRHAPDRSETEPDGCISQMIYYNVYEGNTG